MIETGAERLSQLAARVEAADVDADTDNPIPVEIGRDAGGWHLGFHGLDDETGYQSGPYTREPVPSLLDALHEVLLHRPTRLDLRGLSTIEAVELLNAPALKDARETAFDASDEMTLNDVDVQIENGIFVVARTP